MSRHRAGRDRDHGGTLLELLISVSVMGIIAAALLSVVATFLRNDAQATELIGESRDLQLISTYLPSDMSSAFNTELLVDSNAGDGTAIRDANDPSTAAPCSGYTLGGTNLLSLRWSESFGGTSKQYRVAFRRVTVGTETQIVRVTCDGVSLGAASVKVVAHQLSPTVPVVVTLNPPMVTMTLTEVTGRTLKIVASSQNPNAELEQTSDYDD